MKVNVTFKELNPDFNQEYADEYHMGEESDGNRKVIWSKTYETDNNIDETKIAENGTVPVKYNKSGKSFIKNFKGMTILECHSGEAKVVAFAASKNIIDSIIQHKNSNSKKSYFTFYLKPEMIKTELVDGIFINKEDFPEGYYNF